MRWSCLQFNVLMLPESYRRLPAETRWKPLSPPPLHGQGATLKTILINSKRITAKPAREGSVSMCACTEPVRTGIGAVRVEYGRPKWLINQTNVQKNVFIFLFYQQHPMLVRPAMKRLFCKKRTRSLRSLGLAIFRFFPDFVLFDGFI